MEIVTIFIQNSKKEFLIQKRSKEKNGKYGITSGHTNQEEQPKEAAVREVKEELGLEIKKIELELFYTTKRNQINYSLFFLRKDISIEELILQKEEVDFVRWCTIEEIEELIQKGEFFPTQIEAYEIAKKEIEKNEKGESYGNNCTVGYQ